jgi:hypothetical protein
MHVKFVQADSGVKKSGRFGNVLLTKGALHFGDHSIVTS